MKWLRWLEHPSLLTLLTLVFALISGNTADPDADGRSNLLEFSLNTDPGTPDAGHLLGKADTLPPHP